jgi:CheY-like chemotaxis protein
LEAFFRFYGRIKYSVLLLRYKPGTQRFVIGDPGRVRQILLNLLSNAIKFTEQGHILLTVESTEATDDAALFHISIEDTGIGIAEDRLTQVFNKFDQEDNSTTRKYGGTGLGLAICQQLCNLMHGDITVKSKKGQGSTFSATIQLDVSKESVVGYDSQNQVILQGLKTLIVDDNEIARTILLEQLSVMQMRLVSVTSAKAAMKIMQSAIAEGDPFDIVITDEQMPSMDGESLIREISQHNLLVNGVIILVTSSPYKGQGSRLKAMGLDGYLTKPTYPSEVTQVLSMIWRAKLQGKDIPLITRNMLHETKVRRRDKPVFSNAQILLTEDNPINVTVATELLQGYGCIVTPAGNGLEALTQVKKQQFDLIFMDCQMPEMDGFEATAEIRTLESKQVIKKTPIVAFTANAMRSDEEKCLSVGMDDFITKPINQESLEKVLIKWLSEKMEIVARDEPAASELPQKDQSAQQNVDAEILDLNVFNKLKQMFGDRFSTVIEQNIKNTADNVVRIEETIQQKDLQTLERVAHSIKGTSAQFGAVKLNIIALEMEKLAKNGDLEQAGLLLNNLRVAQEQAANTMQQQIS